MTTAQPTRKRIAFLLYPGLTAFDLAGPLQVLTALAALASEYEPIVVAERLAPHDTDIPGAMTLTPTATFTDVSDPYALIVPGGVTPTLQTMRNEAVRGYVRSAAATADVVGSVCTGALILAAVGLPDGRRATTHWAFHRVLEQFGATYVRRRWVEDGRFICSAGVSAGIDMALQLAARLTDEPTAREVQRRLAYDPDPPFGGIDYDHIGGQLGAWRAAVSRPPRSSRTGRSDSPDRADRCLWRYVAFASLPSTRQWRRRARRSRLGHLSRQRRVVSRAGPDRIPEPGWQRGGRRRSGV